MRVRSLIGLENTLLVAEDVWDEFKDFERVHLPKCEAFEPTDIPN